MLVSPELASGADTSLDLVDDEEDVVLLGQGTQLAEEVRASVVITTLALNGLNDNGAGRQVPALDKMLNLIKTILLGLAVLGSVLLERILELGKSSLRPVEGRNIDLVNSLGSGSRKRAKQTAVETSLKRQDRELRGTRGLVAHGGLELSLGELNIGATTLDLSAVHKSSLVSGLVGVGASHGSEDVVETLGGNLEETALKKLSPVVGRESTESWSVHNGVGHLGGGSGLEEVGVVVTDTNGRNLGEAERSVLVAIFPQLRVVTYTSRSMLPSGSAM